MGMLSLSRRVGGVLLLGFLVISPAVFGQDNRPVIVITPQEVCDYCDTLVDATFDLTGTRLYLAASGYDQEGDIYPFLSLWDVMRTNHTQATSVIQVKSPVQDTRDFMIKLDATGRLIGVAGSALKLWYAELTNGTLPYLATLDKDFTGIHSFAFSDKSDKVAAGYNNHGVDYLGVWDTYQFEDNKPKLLAKVNIAPAVSIQFNPTGRYVLDGRAGLFAEIWDLSQIKNETPGHIGLKEIGGPYTVTFDHDGRQIGVSMGSCHCAGLWSMDSVIKGDTGPIALMQHDSDVYFIAFDPTGRYIVTTSNDHTAKLWNGTQIKEGSPELLATMNHDCSVNQAIFTRNTTRIFTRSSCDIKFWDIQHIKEDGKATLLNTFHTDGGYQKIELDPAGIWLLTVNSYAAELWDIAALQPDQDATTPEPDY